MVPGFNRIEVFLRCARRGTPQRFELGWSWQRGFPSHVIEKSQHCKPSADITRFVICLLWWCRRHCLPDYIRVRLSRGLAVPPVKENRMPAVLPSCLRFRHLPNIPFARAHKYALNAPLRLLPRHAPSVP